MKTNRDKAFTSYLIMLFLNSFVDLGHKITIQNTVFKVYDGQQQIILIAIVNSLILLPFILLLTPSAYLSNRYALVRVMRSMAWLALLLTLLITWFYYQGNYKAAFTMTLMLAIQSALYSPAKYGYIKQLMGEAGLVAANARVQVATIVAILAGTLVFSLLFEHRLALAGMQDNFTESGVLIAVAPLGWLLVISTAIELMMAYRLPVLTQPPEEIAVGFEWRNYLRGSALRSQIRTIRADRAILYSIIGLSIFWGLSQMVLAAFPAYAKQKLMEHNTALIQAMLACSGLGIFFGSLLVGKLSKRTFERPLAEWQLRKQMIPYGALGVTLSLIPLPFTESKLILTLSFFAIGFFGSYFIVPLNAIIQSRTRPGEVGTVLAANNWVQNISMLSFLALTIVSALYGFNSVWLFYMIILIAAVGTLLYMRHGLRDFLQFSLGGLFRLRYRIEAHCAQPFPREEGVLLLGNHVSWIDWALIQLAVPRPIRFVIDRGYYEHPLIHWLLRHINTIAISPTRSKDAIRQISDALRAGDVVCLFPEGHISHDGELKPFKSGYTLAVRNTSAKIIPFYIYGMSGSRFSRVDMPRSRLRDILRFKRREVIVNLGEAVDEISPEALRRTVEKLRDECLTRA